jgi:hypothetical protein
MRDAGPGYLERMRMSRRNVLCYGVMAAAALATVALAGCGDGGGTWGKGADSTPETGETSEETVVPL